MRPGASAAIYSTLFAFPALIHATTVDCAHILVDGVSFNIEALAGPHSVFDIEKTPTATKNTTFTIDVCKALGRTEGVEKPDECENGSWICAFERFYHQNTEGEPSPDDVWPISGDFIHHARDMDAHFTRLKGSDSHADAEKEGFRLEMGGGIHFGVKQKALVEFLCDHDKTGLEGEGTTTKGKRADGNDTATTPPKGDTNKGKSLQFVSYNQTAVGGKSDEEVGILRLSWTTKHACEDQINKPDDGGSSDGGAKKPKRGWGFFTWFIIVLFLVVSAYLIFGSWLNYSRYGARGWDLLPHGDTLRDLPYLMRDWGRRVFSTVQGSGSGGGRGYSAI